MPKINLCPPEFIRERGFYWPRFLLVSGLIIYLIIIFITGAYLQVLRQEEEVRLKSLKGELKLAERGKDEVDKKLELIFQLRQKISFYENLWAADNKWYPGLDLIFHTAGTEIYIDNFSGAASGDFSFTARSKELKKIAGYILDLKEDVNLIYYEYIDRDNEDLYTFCLKGKINISGEGGDFAGETQ